MPFGSFLKYVSGFTSDHAYQTVTIAAQTPANKGVVLTGLTWNLMNQCHSATGGHTFSNNPFDLDESWPDYLVRKHKQLSLLWRKITKNSIDFIFLQEVDIFTHQPSPEMVHKFINRIQTLGWKYIISDAGDNMKQAVATLYNSKKLQFVSKRPLFKGGGDLFTSLEAEFIDLATEEHVCLTNMHLHFKTDHNNDILNYQQAQMQKDIITVIGGDSNPHEGTDYHFFVGDENMPTTVYAYIHEME